MSESLKQKAKTLVELSRMFEQEKVTFRPHESDERHEQRIKKLGAELWIRLEDAEKVIEEYEKDNEALVKTLSMFIDEIVLLKSKLKKQKQKLQQTIENLEEKLPNIEHLL
ncbi:MAG: hypothetical protein ACUVUF_06965 [Candidatus Bathycorpusculaceae bacterium]